MLICDKCYDDRENVGFWREEFLNKFLKKDIWKYFIVW